jgi:hypothetical protein
MEVSRDFPGLPGRQVVIVRSGFRQVSEVGEILERLFEPEIGTVAVGFGGFIGYAAAPFAASVPGASSGHSQSFPVCKTRRRKGPAFVL